MFLVLVRYNKIMFIVWALSWWYGVGWRAQFISLRNQLASSYDYFSIGLSIRNLFAPFRQISAGKVKGPLAVQLRSFMDRQLSRVIGACVRLVLIIIGIIWLTIQCLVGGIAMIFWAVMPVMPLIGFILMLSGWVPAWR